MATIIKIKNSGTSGVPSALATGELAYSYLSNTIFIGTSDGLATINIGGYLYTSDIDSATDAATANKLVRRDATGNASFNYVTANIIGSVLGNANSATQLQTARDFSIDGLIDNQKRPLTELFFTVIWRGYFGWTMRTAPSLNPLNGDPLQEGWEFNLPPNQNGNPTQWWSKTKIGRAHV